MPPIRRRRRAAAFILFGLAAAGTGALAQETTNTIGPPQLKDFSLPGRRTTPPAATPPATTPPPAATPSTIPPARTAPATAPATVRDRATAARPSPPATRIARPDTAAPAPPSANSVPAPQAAAPPPVDSPPSARPQPRSEADAPAVPEARGAGWLWPAAGGLLVLLLGAFLLLRRRRAGSEREEARDAAREELGGALLRAAEPEPEAPTAPRPWIELDIVPERAAATEAEAVVHYALTLTNQGDAPARNIRIDPRLFNAGAEGEMMAFFQGPIHEKSGSPQVLIAPGGTLKLNGQVAMPKAELREIEVAGRRIFVPMVAINVAYDWTEGSGRTSRSWLVGREAETPSAKMGPFRLDLGPRIYRSVGRREGRLVRV
jgi:hypothetical protein